VTRPLSASLLGVALLLLTVPLWRKYKG